MITVLVGKNQRPFLLHFHLLTDSSSYFSKLSLTSSAGNDTSNWLSHKLPEARTETFEIYATWLYTGEICTISSEASTDDSDATLEIEAGRRVALQEDDPACAEELRVVKAELKVLMKCFKLADKLQDAKFHNATIDCWIELIEEKDFYTMPSWSGEKESAFRPLMRLMADAWSHRGNVGYLNEKRGGGTEFWQIVVKALMEKKDSDKGPCYENRCKYHIHAEGEAKCTRLRVQHHHG